MSTVSQPHDAAGLEQLIYQVRGIQAARVVTSESGAIDEVHVVGLPGRSAKQMVRDIESILYVRGGVRLDHRKVSLVQLEEAGVQRQGPRVLLLDVAVETQGPVSAVTVALGLRDQQASSTYSGAEDDRADLLLLTARATVRAIGGLIGPVATLNVERMAATDFGELRVCLSHLSLETETGVETLLGVALVRDAVPAAAARSVLDAVNRPLLRLLSARA
jgi:hypothetical protein